MTTNDELRALLDAATPGPWYYDDVNAQAETVSGQWLGINYSARKVFADAALIAAARNELPRLLDEAERLEYRLARTQEFLVGCCEDKSLKDETIATLEAQLAEANGRIDFLEQENVRLDAARCTHPTDLGVVYHSERERMDRIAALEKQLAESRRHESEVAEGVVELIERIEKAKEVRLPTVDYKRREDIERGFELAMEMVREALTSETEASDAD